MTCMSWCWQAKTVLFSQLRQIFQGKMGFRTVRKEIEQNNISETLKKLFQLPQNCKITNCARYDELPGLTICHTEKQLGKKSDFSSFQGDSFLRKCEIQEIPTTILQLVCSKIILSSDY